MEKEPSLIKIVHREGLGDLLSVTQVAGGDINQAFKLNTSSGTFFIKFNDARRFPGMFKYEASGLKLLSERSTLKVPQVIQENSDNDWAYLILEWIEESGPILNFWEIFGQKLAMLHKQSSDKFGLEYDNYIGSLVQRNYLKDNWIDFFVNERLNVQLTQAIDSRKIDVKISQHFERLYNELNNIFSEEPPSLLHGDLWSGNYMVSNMGEPVIVDPACYYGHREMDIAMTKLFGGFDEKMYAAYREVYPLSSGWEDRVQICNLYPLLVHVNLFGGAYNSQVISIISKF